MSDSVLNVIKRLIFPPRCICCDRLLEPHENAPFCDECSEGIESALVQSYDTDAFDTAISAFYYKPPISKALVSLKKRESAYKIKHLCNFVASTAKEGYDMSRFDMLVCVPSSKQSVNDVGFDRMALYGHALSRRLGIKYEPKAVRKVIHTKKQHLLSKDERLTAQKGAYLADSSVVEGKSILLFDDIITTGATLEECSLAMKRAGAKEIFCITVAAVKHSA